VHGHPGQQVAQHALQSEAYNRSEQSGGGE